MSNGLGCHIPVTLNINFNSKRGFRDAKNLNTIFKGSGPSQKVSQFS